MKLRIKGNSIRFRLTKSEVDYFGKFGLLEETTSFGRTQLIYELKITNQNEGLTATLVENRITLFVPVNMAKEWTTTEKVGYGGEMEIGDGKILYLLLEKDFKCLDETTEDQSDNYDNPLAALKNGNPS